jgi:L-fuculose-phosphate aldolase
MARKAAAEAEIRRGIIDACLALERAGVNQGTSGNVSVRWGDGLLITPSGVPYDLMQPADIVPLAMETADGETDHPLAPSSEWRFHRDILAKRRDLKAVVHTHPTYATALAIRNEAIPAVHYMIAAAGGSTIRCAPYATFGTQELSDNVLTAMKGRKACLLANHGMIAAEKTLAKAVWLAIEVEVLAKQYTHAKLLGEPTVLPNDEIARVVKKFKSYGPRKPSSKPRDRSTS